MELCVLPRSFTGLSTVEVFVTVTTSVYQQIAQLDDVRGMIYG